MTSELRIVIDTSVIVSALLLPRSTPRQALERARKIGILLASEETVDELGAVLDRPKFNKYISLEQRLEFLAAVIKTAEILVTSEMISACRDPRDDKFLELAVSGRATHLVSGDRDLLELHPFRGIPILTPQQFLADVAVQ